MSTDDLPDTDLLLAGIAEAPGAFQLAFQVASGDGQIDSTTFSLVVLPEPGPLRFEATRLPPALAGHDYDVTLAVTGDDPRGLRWDVTDGRLPDGLRLSDRGHVVGTPTGPGATTFTVSARNPVSTVARTFSFRVVPEDPATYRITTFEVAALDPQLRPHLDEAVRRWERALVGDLPVEWIRPGFFHPSTCGGYAQWAEGTVADDLLLLVDIDSIDGSGAVLGRAGVCAVRRADGLPFVGLLTLDEADLVPLVGSETLTDLLQHEIAHALGFGTLWPTFELLVGGFADPRFIGAAAVEAYHDATAATDSVPVENHGGQGTVRSHWREAVFGTELMTGFVERPGVDMALSRMTLASFQDLGYQVDLDAAETTVGPLRLRALRAGPAAPPFGYDQVLREPILVSDPDPRTLPGSRR